jgi:hypothetical protein
MDWKAWYRGYDDPASDLSQRLVIVRRCIGEALDALATPAPRVLSLCAGDGRDLLPELAARPSLHADALVVELDPDLAAGARTAAASLSLDSVRVVCADAGDPEVFGSRLPVDLLLLCGIFGNIEEADIRATVAAAAAMVAPGGYAIWTRGPMQPDLRPTIRGWFIDAGFEEISYDGEPAPYGIGMARRGASLNDAPPPIPTRLFTFTRER